MAHGLLQRRARWYTVGTNDTNEALVIIVLLDCMRLIRAEEWFSRNFYRWAGTGIVNGAVNYSLCCFLELIRAYSCRHDD